MRYIERTHEARKGQRKLNNFHCFQLLEQSAENVSWLGKVFEKYFRFFMQKNWHQP